MKISKIGENGLIRRIAKRVRNDRTVLKGIGDDCAVLKFSESKDLLLASDMLVEGVHFLKSAPPEAIGWKALAVNISDVAAIGGVPRHAVLSLGLPRGTAVAFVDRLYEGLNRCARRFKVNLVGGDTVRSSKVVIDVAILGEVESGRWVSRAGAKAGDSLLVTGRLGGSVRSGRHLRFIPRVREARMLVSRFKLHAMMDLSDGLWADLARLCEQSRVGAELEASRIPRRPGVSVRQALTDGEDFELLIAADKSQAERMLAWAKKGLSCGLTRIGRIVAGREKAPIRIVGPRGTKLSVPLSGFRHF